MVYHHTQGAFIIVGNEVIVPATARQDRCTVEPLKALQVKLLVRVTHV